MRATRRVRSEQGAVIDDVSYVTFLERSMRVRFLRARVLAELRSMWTDPNRAAGLISTCYCFGAPSAMHLVEPDA